MGEAGGAQKPHPGAERVGQLLSGPGAPTSSAKPPVSLPPDARHPDPGTPTSAAPEPGGWSGFGRPHLPGSARKTRTLRGPERGPPLRSFASSGPPPPRSEARLRLALAAALAVRGWAREETEPPRAPRTASGAVWPPPAPPSRLCAGSVAAARSAPAPSAPRLLGAEATPAAVS